MNEWLLFSSFLSCVIEFNSFFCLSNYFQPNPTNQNIFHTNLDNLNLFKRYFLENFCSKSCKVTVKHFVPDVAVSSSRL